MTFALKKTHIEIVLLILLFFTFTLFCFLITGWVWLFSSAAVITLVATIYLWFKNRRSDKVDDQKSLGKNDQDLIKKLFYFFVQELKDRGQYQLKYDTPWYLYISHNIKSDEVNLTQMGFRTCAATSISKDIPIQMCHLYTLFT